MKIFYIFSKDILLNQTFDPEAKKNVAIFLSKITSERIGACVDN